VTTARVPCGTGSVRAMLVTLLLTGIATSAAAASASAEWRQAETEHFLIVFEPQDQRSADELAAICEDVYAKVTGFFRSYPKKVPVVIRGRLDYANGMTAPFPGRLELIVTAPSWPWMGARSESWLRILLTHEFTHYVHLGMERGFFNALSRVFGADARWAASVFLPGWMLEGPTTNLETLFTSGGRGRNPFFESLYRAPVIEGDLFSLAQASYASSFPPSGRIYVAGYVLVDYLLKTYGEDAFTRIMDLYLAFPFFGPWASIERVTGKKAKEVFADMKAGLEERCRGAAGIPGGGRISPDRIGDWQHPVPTERGIYACRTDLESFPAIVRLDPFDGSEEEIASISVTDPSSFTATADGRTVYAASFFADWRPTDGEEAVSDLSEIDAETGAVRRITMGAHLWHPAVSADGRLLVAVQGVGSFTRLVEVDPSTGRTRVLFSVSGTNVFNPAFSPDGTRIALVLNQRGVQDVVVIDYAEAVAGSCEIADPHAPVEDVNAGLAAFVLGPDAFGEYFPAWYGNERLLLCSDRSGSLALYEADLATGGVALVQEDPVAAYEGFVDGDALVYASYSSKGFCLKRAPFAPEAVPAVPVERGPADPLPAQVPPAAVASTPYQDRARPYLWYPLVTLGAAAGSLEDFLTAISTGDPSVWDFGVGAEVLAGSYVGTSAWSLGAAWHPLTSQPEISFSLSHGFGNATVDLSSDLGYFSYGSACFLDSDTRLGVSLPLVSRSAYDYQVALSVGAGATFLSQVGSYDPFTFFDALCAGPGVWAHAVLLDAGLGFGWAKPGGSIDFVAPRLASISVGGNVMLPALDGSTGVRLNLLAQAGMPVFWQHLVLRAGLKASYVTGSLARSYESFAVPRGMFDGEVRPLSGRLLTSLDLLAPIGLFDQPLILGIALLGLSAGAHVEAAADWGFGPAAFQIPWICAGAEVAFQLGASSISLPVGVGIAARFDPTGATPFDISTDLRPYVFLSFDSFRDAWKAARAGRQIVLR
jgi:hypothetical protein